MSLFFLSLFIVWLKLFFRYEKEREREYCHNCWSNKRLSREKIGIKIQTSYSNAFIEIVEYVRQKNPLISVLMVSLSSSLVTFLHCFNKQYLTSGICALTGISKNVLNLWCNSSISNFWLSTADLNAVIFICSMERMNWCFRRRKRRKIQKVHTKHSLVT